MDVSKLKLLNPKENKNKRKKREGGAVRILTVGRMALHLSTCHLQKPAAAKLCAFSAYSSYSPSRNCKVRGRLSSFNNNDNITSSLTNFGSLRSGAEWTRRRHTMRWKPRAEAGGGGAGIGHSSGGGGGGGGGGEGESENEKNRAESMMALAALGRSLESIPADLAMAVKEGKVPAAIIDRYAELEKSGFFRWLLQFGGFKERLLADDLFLAKVAMECGVGIFTKTAAELERRRENFMKEIDFVIADVVMAIVADFMLVWLPAPTVSLRPALSREAGMITKFFYNCPDNAFQVALRGTSYSFLQRVGAIVRNGAKLFCVGTSASLIGTGATNLLINARKAVDKEFAGEAEDVPVVSTSVAYGVYMAVSSNLRYQILAGVIEQRILEPLLHNRKLLLSSVCFAVRTGNTFLGSLMWVDYARWTGIQKIRE